MSRNWSKNSVWHKSTRDWCIICWWWWIVVNLWKVLCETMIVSLWW